MGRRAPLCMYLRDHGQDHIRRKSDEADNHEHASRRGIQRPCLFKLTMACCRRTSHAASIKVIRRQTAVMFRRVGERWKIKSRPQCPFLDVSDQHSRSTVLLGVRSRKQCSSGNSPRCRPRIMGCEVGDSLRSDKRADERCDGDARLANWPG